MIVYTNFNQGRLGNQLFFVASTIGIAIKNNTNWGFSTQMGHGGINYQSIFEKEVPITSTIPSQKYHQNGFSFHEIEIDDVELVGYFQSEKFFKHCETVIREQFEFKKTFVQKVLVDYPNIKNSLTIHIRRGDYVGQPNHHPTTPLSYYNKILNEIEYNYENVYVFSDDEDWVKQNFIGEKYIFPKFDIENDLYCFILMSLGRDNVISNSTYSWWAAWLNKNTNKKIYSPTHKNWFGSAYSNLDTKDLIPDNWIQIEY